MGVALRQLAGIRELCINLKHFTNEQIDDFKKGLADAETLWPKLHSLSIDAHPRAAIELMRHASPRKIKAFHLCDDVESTPFQKAIGIRGLESLHLNFDMFQLGEGDFWRKIRWLYVGTQRSMSCLVLREKCSDANMKVPLSLVSYYILYLKLILTYCNVGSRHGAYQSCHS